MNPPATLDKKQRITILGVPFDYVSSEEALQLVLAKLKNKPIEPHQTETHSAFFIATPNPEMLLEAEKNPAFKKILHQTDLNIADGSGILWASHKLNDPLPERVTGVDLMQSICEKAPKGTKIFLLGAQEGVAEKTKHAIEAHRNDLKIVGTYAGSPALEEEQKILSMINESDAEILFVAFGAPKQELWLSRNLSKMPKIKVTMGVGGAFDFIAGIRKRAPLWMQKMSLEWLFRLIQEPKRIKRIFNATVKFPVHFLFSKKNIV